MPRAAAHQRQDASSIKTDPAGAAAHAAAQLSPIYSAADGTPLVERSVRRPRSPKDPRDRIMMRIPMWKKHGLKMDENGGLED